MAFAQNISYSHCFPSTPGVNPNPAAAIIPSQTSPQSPTSASTLRSSPILSAPAVITNGPPIGPVSAPVTACEVSGPQIASLFPHFSDAASSAAPSLYAPPYRNPQSAYFPFGPTPPEPGSLYHPLNTTAPYALPDNRGTPGYGWRAPSLTQPPCPYDPTAYPHPYQYPGGGYASSLDSSRRKNATRESTATLKAWLQEHIQNPYPTKGEKIMLAIITKMTLTQVSTWFANARRRLKKENKMTWSPKVKVDHDDDDKSSEHCKDEDDEDDIDKDKVYHLTLPLEKPTVDSDYTPACVSEDYPAGLNTVGSG